jgi:DNA-binding MarR family transcriptional regulator
MTKPPALKLDDFAPYRLSVAANAVSDVIAVAYRTLFGLTVAEWRLVSVLAERPAVSQMELGQATRMDKVTVSRAAIRLSGRHLVKRAENNADKRANLLSLTDRGEALYRQVAPKALALEAAMLADFTPDEVAQLMAMLRRLEAAAAGMSAV